MLLDHVSKCVGSLNEISKIVYPSDPTILLFFLEAPRLVDVQAKQSAHAALEADVKRLHKDGFFTQSWRNHGEVTQTISSIGLLVFLSWRGKVNTNRL